MWDPTHKGSHVPKREWTNKAFALGIDQEFAEVFPMEKKVNEKP